MLKLLIRIFTYFDDGTLPKLTGPEGRYAITAREQLASGVVAAIFSPISLSLNLSGLHTYRFK